MTGTDFERPNNAEARLLAEVRELFAAIDPPPVDLGERVKFALTVHALNAEVADLTANPLVEVRTQQAEETPTVTFSSSKLSLMISVTPEHDDTLRLDGWVTQAGARIAIHADAGYFDLLDVPPVAVVAADVHGRFAVEGVSRGRLLFVVDQFPENAGVASVITPIMEF